jgi:hypothetical protein
VTEKQIARLAGLAIFAYFLSFAVGALPAHWAPDDPMNLGQYWRFGFLRCLGDVVRFWSPAYRPMGAMFYLPVYFFAGIEPIPYRIAIFAILGVNTWMSYRIADRLTKSKATAALTAVLVCAHASMVAIYYNTSQIYDILAFFFLAVMLLCYMRFRESDPEGDLTALQTTIVVAAFIAALDSKEIAVTGCGWILAYELLFRRPSKPRTSAILVLAAIVYTLGKELGPNALSTKEGYALELTAHRYFVNNAWYLNDLFYTFWFSSARRVVMAWLILTLICAIARRRELWWGWFVITTVTLPTSFTVTPRGGPGLYLPLLGWAIVVSTVTVTFLKPRFLQWAAAVVVAVAFAHRTIPDWYSQRQAYIDEHARTWSVLSQLRELPARPAHHSRILFLSNPFREWDTFFIATLLWNDRSLDVELADKLPRPPDPDRFDWVLAFEDDKLRVVRTR